MAAEFGWRDAFIRTVPANHHVLAEPSASVAVLAATEWWRAVMRAVSVLSFSLLLAMSGMAMSEMALAQSRVGVTSGTSGDPLGKPPAEAERVLRVGVDVKANEAITTGAADRAHLLFLDGSSLTVGPQARLIIDKFIYDPATKT